MAVHIRQYPHDPTDKRSASIIEIHPKNEADRVNSLLNEAGLKTRVYTPGSDCPDGGLRGGTRHLWDDNSAIETIIGKAEDLNTHHKVLREHGF